MLFVADDLQQHFDGGAFVLALFEAEVDEVEQLLGVLQSDEFGQQLLDIVEVDGVELEVVEDSNGSAWM